MALSVFMKNAKNEVLKDVLSSMRDVSRSLSVLKEIDKELYTSLIKRTEEITTGVKDNIKKFEPIVLPHADFVSANWLLDSLNDAFKEEKKPWIIDEFAFDNMPAYCHRCINDLNITFKLEQDVYLVKAYAFECESRAGSEIYSMVVFTFPGKLLVVLESDNPNAFKPVEARDSLINNEDFIKFVKEQDSKVKALNSLN